MQFLLAWISRFISRSLDYINHSYSRLKSRLYRDSKDESSSKSNFRALYFKDSIWKHDSQENWVIIRWHATYTDIQIFLIRRHAADTDTYHMWHMICHISYFPLVLELIWIPSEFGIYDLVTSGQIEVTKWKVYYYNMHFSLYYKLIYCI